MQHDSVERTELADPGSVGDGEMTGNVHGPQVILDRNALTETSSAGAREHQRAAGSWEGDLAPGAKTLPSAGRNGSRRQRQASCPAG